MPTTTSQANGASSDKERLSSGSLPTGMPTSPQAPVRHRVTERILGFWVNGADLSKIEDSPARGYECDTVTLLETRAADLVSSTVHVPRGPIHVSWARHSLFHPQATRPPTPEPINFPQYVLDSISSQIFFYLQRIFPEKSINVRDFVAFVINQLRIRQQEVCKIFKDMRDCDHCYRGSNTGIRQIYGCLLSRELGEDRLANDDKLIQVLRETAVILEDASHPDNPLTAYPIWNLRQGGVETFVLSAFLIALGESEGHTENHARLAIEILSAALPEGHRYAKYMNLDFLDLAMADLHGYRRSYVKFPQ